MSWENRFSNIVHETERNIASLQKRLATYVYPVTPCSLVDESVARIKDIDPCCNVCYMPPCNPCYMPPCKPCLPACKPCLPCPVHPCNYPIGHPLCQITDQKQEISVLKKHIRDLEVDNDRQKRQQRETASEAGSYRTKSPPYSTPSSPMPQQPISITPLPGQIAYQAGTPQPCNMALELRDMVNQWKNDVTPLINNLQNSGKPISKPTTPIDAATKKNNDSIKKELSELRQYICGEVNDVRVELNTLKKNCENIKNTLTSMHGTMKAREQKSLDSVFNPDLKEEADNQSGGSVKFRGGAQPSLSEELKNTVDALREQVRLIEQYVYGQQRQAAQDNVPYGTPLDSYAPGQNQPIVDNVAYPPSTMGTTCHQTMPTCQPPLPSHVADQMPNYQPYTPQAMPTQPPMRPAAMPNQTANATTPNFEFCKICFLPLGAGRPYCVPYSKPATVTHCCHCVGTPGKPPQQML